MDCAAWGLQYKTNTMGKITKQNENVYEMDIKSIEWGRSNREVDNYDDDDDNAVIYREWLQSLQYTIAKGLLSN